MENEKKKAEVKKVVETKKVEKVKEATYIMTVTHLSWGANNRNHFYADKKPLISKKVMGKFADKLDIWIKEGWVKEGSYKK